MKGDDLVSNIALDDISLIPGPCLGGEYRHRKCPFVCIGCLRPIHTTHEMAFVPK